MILALARETDLSLKNVSYFILDECDKMLESLGILLSSFLLCIEFFLVISFSSYQLYVKC
jgi:hypothetical protein